MGEEREAVFTPCLHTICWHIPHSTWSLFIRAPWCSHSHPIRLSSGGILHHAQAFPGSEEMAVLFLSFYATLSQDIFLMKLCWAPSDTHQTDIFPKPFNTKDLEPKKQKMIPLLLDAAELFDLHSAQPGSTRTRLTSLSSPYDPYFPYKPLSLPTNSTPPPPPPPPSKAHGIFMANMFGVAERC